MLDAVECLLVTLAVTLGGAAIALGARLVRAAWRDARSALDAVGDRPAPARKPIAAQRRRTSLSTAFQPRWPAGSRRRAR